MSEILIDRDLLRQILHDYFEYKIEARAYVGVQQHWAVKQSDPTGLHLFLESLEAEKQKELDETEGIQERLRDTLAAEDDAAFLRVLSAEFRPEKF
jgi:hypothetical protein